MRFIAIIIIIILVFGFVNSSRLTAIILNPFLGPLGAIASDSVHDIYIYIPRVKGKVVVKYDKYGIPYIQANNFKDLYFAFGFIQAKDRLFQMDLMRRYAEGKLSALLGKSLLDVDEELKIIGLYRAAKKTYNALLSNSSFKDVVECLKSFSEGVNTYIKYAVENKQLPFEYRVLNVLPENWTPVDSLAIGKLIAWSLSDGFIDLELKAFLDIAGYDALIYLDILNRSLNKPILSNFTIQDPPKIKILSNSPDNYYNRNINDLKHLISNLEKVLKVESYLIGNCFGSNNWVISGNYTTTGYPILANDPHLSMQAPPVWYEAELIIPGKLSVLNR